jgi:hypothetical protein
VNAVAWDVVDRICSEVLLWSGVVGNQIKLIVDAGRGRRVMGSGETRQASKQASKQPSSKQELVVTGR